MPSAGRPVSRSGSGRKATIASCEQHAHARWRAGGLTLKLGLATYFALLAALSLAFHAAPCANAMAAAVDSSPAATVAEAGYGPQMADDMAAIPCDHGQTQAGEDQPDTKCRPGMACYAALSQSPAQRVNFEPISYELERLGVRSDAPVQSHPPDPSLRPPRRL